MELWTNNGWKCAMRPPNAQHAHACANSLIPSSACLLRPDHLMLPCPLTKRQCCHHNISSKKFCIRSMSCSGGCEPECYIHPVHCYLSAQFTNVHSRILSMCMLSILGLYGMNPAIIIHISNSISQNLLIEVRIMP